MSYITNKLDKIFLLIEKIFDNTFTKFIKTNNYYKLYNKEIDILYNKLFIDNIPNLINTYYIKKQQPNFGELDLLFLWNYSYSRNNEWKESFRMMFPFLPNQTFDKNIDLVNKLWFNINKKDKQLLSNYIDKKPNNYYNLWFSFWEEIKLWLKVFLNCSLEEIKQNFPDIYNSLFKQFPKLNPKDYPNKTLFGIDFNKDGRLNNFKLYSNYEFIEKTLLEKLPSEYKNIIENQDNDYMLKYVVRWNKLWNISYKINIINIENKINQKYFQKYFPDINDELPIEIIWFSFDRKNNHNINKVDCYLTF